MDNKENKKYRNTGSSRHGNIDGFVIPRSKQKSRNSRGYLSQNTAQVPKIPLVTTKSSFSPTTALSLTSYSGKAKKPTHKRRIAKRIVLATLALLIAVGGYLGWSALGGVNKVLHGNILSDAQALFSNVKLKGEDQGRVNILLAGNSADDPGHGGADLTDSIMVLSIDTQKHTAFMLSVPRDLWVNIPGIGHGKINAAFTNSRFNQSGYPNGGMGQLEQVVSQDLGIPIDYYSLINYTAFKDAVNAVSGITINIQSADPRGLYDPNIGKADGGPLKLPNGVQVLNGQTALNLARARGDPTYDGRVAYGFPQSDFDRTQHQRQMLLALEQKATSVGVISNPLKINQLIGALGKNVSTDLNLGDVLRLDQLTKGINISTIQSLALTNSGSSPLLRGYLANDGEEALIPSAGIDDYTQVQQYYKKLTSDNPIIKESASVVILNGSNISGLAHKEKLILQNKGFNVIGIADTNSQYTNSLVVDLSGGKDPATDQSLQKLFSPNTPSATNTTESPEAGEAVSYNANFVVIIGKNQASSTPSNQ